MAVHHAQPSIRESSGWGEESASPAPRKPRGAGLAGPARAAFREAGPGDEGSDAADLEESLEDHVSSAMDHQVESEPSMGVPPRRGGRGGRVAVGWGCGGRGVAVGGVGLRWSSVRGALSRLPVCHHLHLCDSSQSVVSPFAVSTSANWRSKWAGPWWAVAVTC